MFFSYTFFILAVIRMYEKLSRILTDKLVELKILDIKDFDVYQYGFELLISTIFTTAVVFVISIIVGRFIETTIYLIGFFCIRAICGGFHAKHHYSCFITTILTYFAFLIIHYSTLKTSHIKILVGLFVLSSVIIIFCLAPVEHPNNPMTEYRKKKNRIVSIFFSIFTIFVFAVSVLFNTLTKTLSPFFIGVFIASVSILAAKIENEFYKRKEVKP